MRFYERFQGFRTLRIMGKCSLTYDTSLHILLGVLPPDRSAIRNIYDLEAKLSGVELSITDAVSADSATYECKATNSQGEVTKQITVTVNAV